MLPKRKSLIRVRRKVTYTDGGNVKPAVPAFPQRKGTPKSSKISQKPIDVPCPTLTKFKPGKELWKNVPMAIRYAKSRTDRVDGPGLGRNSELVDEKLRDMCEKAFVTGEMECRAYTLEEIGSYVGISRERVRQIQEEALNNVRSIMRERFGWEMSFDDLLEKGSSVFESKINLP